MTDQTPTTIQRARVSRRNPTNAEGRMWSLLRDRRLRYKFRRQHPIGKYVVDFACPAIQLVIEVDGPSHDAEAQRVFDEARTEYHQQAGWRVMRVPNDHVYQSPGEVEAAIWSVLEP
ncbi:MAG: endonuclease domain-containing protein [Hyphomonadaceae bacterium]|nr:endonuclease domain-containing protein [Hyphomonadaceae bacterium]